MLKNVKTGWQFQEEMGAQLRVRLKLDTLVLSALLLYVPRYAMMESLLEMKNVMTLVKPLEMDAIQIAEKKQVGFVQEFPLCACLPAETESWFRLKNAKMMILMMGMVVRVLAKLKMGILVTELFLYQFVNLLLKKYAETGLLIQEKNVMIQIL